MFSLWSPIFRFPLSGDVSQDIDPAFTRIAGVPEIEAKVVHEVASYGRQLSRLSEAVLAIAEAQGVEGPEVTALREMVLEIDALKARNVDALTRDAEAALSRLREVDEGAWTKVSRGVE